jgi:hypothetical protein
MEASIAYDRMSPAQLVRMAQRHHTAAKNVIYVSGGADLRATHHRILEKCLDELLLRASVTQLQLVP